MGGDEADADLHIGFHKIAVNDDRGSPACRAYVHQVFVRVMVVHGKTVGHLLPQFFLLVGFHERTMTADGHDDFDVLILDSTLMQFFDDKR